MGKLEETRNINLSNTAKNEDTFLQGLPAELSDTSAEPKMPNTAENKQGHTTEHRQWNRTRVSMATRT